jgi:HPt (histidine-containing phosphotransfer) domain-containing protein
MDDYLAKPVELATLRAKLAQWLPASDVVIPATPISAATQVAPERALNPSALENVFGRGSPYVRDTLGRFMKTFTDDLKRLSDAVARADAEQTRMLAHRIKGAAKIVGAAPLAMASGTVEECAKAEAWDTVGFQMKLIVQAETDIGRILETM